MTRIIQPSFAGGELTPALYGRVDLEKYSSGLALCKNFICQPHGGVANRPGFEVVDEVADSAEITRLIPFQYNTEQSYALELGDGTLRIVANGAYVREADKTITGITNASPGVVTIATHGYSTGDKVFLSSIVGMTELNQRQVTVTVVDPNTFSVGIDTTGYTAYGSAGTAAKYLEVATSYAAADIFRVKFAQSADVIYLVHPDYDSYQITRVTLSPPSWTVTETTFDPLEARPTSCVASANKDATNEATRRYYKYRITAELDDGGEGLPGLGMPWTLSAATAADPVEVTLSDLNASAPAIAGITRNDPANVTTTSKHGLKDGDRVYISGVTGMTEVNDRWFSIAKVDRTTFKLEGEDSTDHTSWGSGGTVRRDGMELASGDELYIEGLTEMTELNGRLFEVVQVEPHKYELRDEDGTTYTPETTGGTAKPTHAAVPYGAKVLGDGSWVDLEWVAPVGYDDLTLFHIYRSENGLYGWIGSVIGTKLTFKDDYITPVLSDTPKVIYNPFIEDDDKPATVTLHDQRGIWGGTNNSPQKKWYSRVGSYTSMNYSTPSRAADGFSYEIAALMVNEIRHLASLGDLVVLTSGGEWIVSPGGDSDTLTPTSWKIDQHDQKGCSHVRPVRVGKTLLFVQARGQAIMDLAYKFEADGYVGNETSLLAEHLFRDCTVVDMDYQQRPNSVIWVVLSTGKLLGLTYLRDQQVWAWHQHETDGFFESVCCIPEGNMDAVYVVVKRRVGGVYKRFVERMHDRYFESIKDAFFVDSGLTYDNPEDIGLLFEGAADTVNIGTADHGLVDHDRIEIEGVVGITGLNDTKYSAYYVTDHQFGLYAYGTTTPIKWSDIDTTDGYISGGVWRKLVTSVGGLWHLEGKTVTALTDGNVMPDQVVANGQITLGDYFGRIHCGLSYDCDIKTLRVTDLPKMKSIGEITAMVELTRGFKVGPDFDTLTEVKQRHFELWGDPTEPKTGTMNVLPTPDFKQEGQICLRQEDPLPTTILALVPEVISGS